MYLYVLLALLVLYIVMQTKDGIPVFLSQTGKGEYSRLSSSSNHIVKKEKYDRNLDRMMPDEASYHSAGELDDFICKNDRCVIRRTW